MHRESSPTARSLLALQLLQASPGITAERLADKLGVSERAARRYVAILRESGVPIESTRGPYGGYRVGRGLRLPPLTFSTTEALGLVMAVLDGHHDPAGASDPAGSALGKLLQALPAPVARQAEAVRRTAAAPDRAAARPDPEITTRLAQASADRLQVRLDYRSEAGTRWSLQADPWAVVVRHGRWYLLCWSHRSSERRAYRIDRVIDVEVLAEGFVAPADLDPVAELEAHLAVGWEFETDVVVNAPYAVAARHLPRALGRLAPVDDTTTRLTGSTSNLAWYAEALVALPSAYRIVGGPELRETARTLAQRMLAATTEPPYSMP